MSSGRVDASVPPPIAALIVGGIVLAVALAVDLRGDGASVRAFVDRLRLRALRRLLDPDGEIARRYAVFSLPTTFFVDRDGRIGHIEVGGPMSDATIERGLERAGLGTRGQ